MTGRLTGVPVGLPYSGRIHIDCQNGRRREFILLGRQDGPAIRDRLLPTTARLSVGADDAVPAAVFDPGQPRHEPGIRVHVAP